MLEELNDEDLHWRVWGALIELDADAQLDSLPEPLATYWTTQRVDYEVNNGGFLQLFHNSAHQLVDDALQGFTTLGLEEHAGLLRRAIAIADQGEVQAEIERIWAADDNLREFSRVADRGFFEELDQAWFALPAAIDVGLTHLRNHASLVEPALPPD